MLMYIISVMIFTFSTRDFGHPKFLKSQFGHPVMKVLAKSMLQWTLYFQHMIPKPAKKVSSYFHYIYSHILLVNITGG